MGCVSSKLFKKEIQREIVLNNGGAALNHVVSLTSSTYGALSLDKAARSVPFSSPKKQPSPLEVVEEAEKKKKKKKKEEEEDAEKTTLTSPEKVGEENTEIIDARELMGDLEEETSSVSSGSNKEEEEKKRRKNSPKPKLLFEAKSPLKFLNQFGSPRKARTYGGKENKVKRGSEFSPRPGLKGGNNGITGKGSKAVLRLSYTPVRQKGSSSPCSNPSSNESSGGSSNGGGTKSGKGFSPLFDPELVALYEKELTEEEEQVKRIISLTPRSRRLGESRKMGLAIKRFELNCPPGGENSVVIYTTTLRGIRKTFEDCNVARSIIQSYCVRVIERDVSMDSGFKEELRGLMGAKEVKVPVVFVKGRLIGGAEQLVKLEEEGKLAGFLEGIPKMVTGGCEGCGGIRFVMCMGCNGSTKVLDEATRKMVRCGECNENGLIRCPICC